MLCRTGFCSGALLSARIDLIETRVPVASAGIAGAWPSAGEALDEEG